jgi:hypothetical protein
VVAVYDINDGRFVFLSLGFNRWNKGAPPINAFCDGSPPYWLRKLSGLGAARFVAPHHSVHKVPDRERVAIFQRLEATEKGRALNAGCARELICKNLFAAVLFLGGVLHVRVLIVAGNLRIAVFRALYCETEL